MKYILKLAKRANKYPERISNHEKQILGAFLLGILSR